MTRLSEPFARFVAPARARPQVWRLLLGLVLIALVYVGLNMGGLLFYVWRSGLDAVEPLLAKVAVASTPGTALLLLASFAPIILGTFAAARLLHKRGPATLFGPFRPVLRDFLRAALATFAFFGTLAAIGLAFIDSDPYLPPRLWFSLLPLTLLGVAVQTLAEEILFRGYLQQQLAARTALRVFWMILPALLFGALHFDPATFGSNAYIPVSFAFVFGLIAADLTARTGTLGAAWGMHFAINLLGIGFVGAGTTITGLALRTVPLDPSEAPTLPVLLATDALPLVLAWLVLRRVLRR